MIWIVLILIVILVIYLISIYNRLIVLRNNRENAFADIDVQLKQRFDLVPNLVSTVKWYASHEQAVYDSITKARESYQSAWSADQKIAASNMLSGALNGLLAIVESNPELKANTNFMQLQSELADIENKIAASRRYFNSATKEYNTSLETFPNNVFANMFGFKKWEYFEVANEAEKESPKVQF